MTAFFALPMSWYALAEKKADFPTNRAATLLSILWRYTMASLPPDRVAPFTKQAAPVCVRVKAPVACCTVPAPTVPVAETARRSTGPYVGVFDRLKFARCEERQPPFMMAFTKAQGGNCSSA